MATPPDSSGLFLSSSSAGGPRGPPEDVEQLLAQARTVDKIDPTVHSFISSNRKAFLEVFSRRVSLIKSRSQSFQDCQVTIFDKALLELTQNGHVLISAASVYFFCKEFLAISSNASDSQKLSALSDALVLSTPKVPAIAPLETKPRSFSPGTSGGIDAKSPQRKPPFGRQLQNLNSPTLAALAAEVGDVATRLWTVYDQAKEEFYAIAEPNSIAKQKAAKFLRDTAENTLQYLQDRHGDLRLLREVETNLEVSKHIAMALHGGKKRKFDQPEPEEDGQWIPQTRVARPDPSETRQVNARYERDLRARNEVAGGDFPGHSRAIVHYQRARLSRGAAHGRHNEVVELFPERSPQRKKKQSQRSGKQQGRGHSGVPFGYSRPVDSYQPES